jgi:uncharacterized membrane protein
VSRRPLSGPRFADRGTIDMTIGRLITVGTYVAVALLAIGVVLLLAAGHSPLEGGPPLDLAALPSDLLALRPEGFLWLGLLTVIAIPSARVGAALVAYAMSGERAMAVVSAAILGVIALSVGLGMGLEG